MDFQEFLNYLLTVNGINAAVGVVMSFVVEWFPAFTNLQPKAKRLFFLGLNIVIAIVSALLLATAGYAPWDFNILFWPALVAGFTAFATGTAAHTRTL